MKEHPEIHIPSPSYWPILMAFGFALIAGGVISTIFVSLVGVVVMLTAIGGWTLENRSVGQDEDHG